MQKLAKEDKHSLSTQAICIHSSKESNNSSHRDSFSVHTCKKVLHEFCYIIKNNWFCLHARSMHQFIKKEHLKYLL